MPRSNVQGAERSLTACVRGVRRQGTIAQVGLYTGKTTVDFSEWWVKDMAFELVLAYPVQIWPRIIAMVEAGIYPIEKIVTRANRSGAGCQRRVRRVAGPGWRADKDFGAELSSSFCEQKEPKKLAPQAR